MDMNQHFTLKIRNGPQRTLSLAFHLLVVVLLGLMAGFFATYSFNVNLAMLELDGPTYAKVQSAFNRNVRHLGFFTCFFGPLPLGLLSLALVWADKRRLWWWLLALTTVIYAIGIVLFTRQVNLPLNYLTESWAATAVPPDWENVREAWNFANFWRSGLSLALFLASLAALMLRLKQPSLS